MKIITPSSTLPLSELTIMAETLFGNFVKAVVDIEKNIMMLDAELHADLESMLLEQGSDQENLWGINFYPEVSGDDFIEFDSMINVRPSANNRSRSVENVDIQKKIRVLVEKLIVT